MLRDASLIRTRRRGIPITFMSTLITCTLRHLPRNPNGRIASGPRFCCDEKPREAADRIARGQYATRGGIRAPLPLDTRPISLQALASGAHGMVPRACCARMATGTGHATLQKEGFALGVGSGIGLQIRFLPELSTLVAVDSCADSVDQ